MLPERPERPGERALPRGLAAALAIVVLAAVAWIVPGVSARASESGAAAPEAHAVPSTPAVAPVPPTPSVPPMPDEELAQAAPEPSEPPEAASGALPAVGGAPRAQPHHRLTPERPPPPPRISLPDIFLGLNTCFMRSAGGLGRFWREVALAGAVTFRWLEQALGALLVLFILLDVFLTVLYARIGASVLARWLARLTWWLFRGISKPFGRHRAGVLSFCGPAILVVLVLFWALGLAVGTGMVFHPRMGTSIRSSHGETPRDFLTAMYAGGGSMSIVGANDFGPETGPFRLLFLFNSLVGLCVTTLTLTYFMQVYAALQRRNTLALKLHLASAETGDAAELLAGLGPEGRFDGGYDHLVELSAEMANAKESHHFYPVLFYFRFRDPLYAVSRSTLIAFDVVTLIKSALDDERDGWLKESVAVTQLWRASMHLVTTLEGTFLPERAARSQEPPDAETLERWRRRYLAGLRRLRQAGIETLADERSGAETYLSLRAQWDPHIRALAPAMAYSLDEIDPAGCRPESADEREGFRSRLRTVDNGPGSGPRASGARGPTRTGPSSAGLCGACRERPRAAARGSPPGRSP